VHTVQFMNSEVEHTYSPSSGGNDMAASLTGPPRTHGNLLTVLRFVPDQVLDGGRLYRNLVRECHLVRFAKQCSLLWVATYAG